MAGKARAGREYFCKYFCFPWMPYKQHTLGNINCPIILFYRRLEASAASAFASTVIWNFCSQTEGPWRLLWCPDGVMWHWSNVLVKDLKTHPWSVWESVEKRAPGCICHLMRWWILGSRWIWIASQLKRQIEVGPAPWGSSKAPESLWIRPFQSRTTNQRSMTAQFPIQNNLCELCLGVETWMVSGSGQMGTGFGTR